MSESPPVSSLVIRSALANTRANAQRMRSVTVSLESWEKKSNNSELVASEVPLPKITIAWRQAFQGCMAEFMSDITGFVAVNYAHIPDMGKRHVLWSSGACFQWRMTGSVTLGKNERKKEKLLHGV
uniref:Uncharacterized protein n=1 Tax=Pipistrellus kuhlii TaxID=59472 RepID=A0A7J7WDC7_PIPKU|nr:hypothetical protein mPipKuh1_008004 [Pipistrellus kuhlii]